MSPRNEELFSIAGIAGVLFILGVVIASSALVASKGRRLDWRKMKFGAPVLAFGMPVVIFLTMLVMRTAQQAPQRIVVQTSESHPSMAQPRPTQPRVQSAFKTDGVATTQVAVEAEAPQEKTATTPSAETKLPLPEWVTADEIRSEGTGARIFVISSERFATTQEADANVMNIARSNIKNDFCNVYNLAVSPPVGDAEIQKAYLRRYEEQITVKTGTSEFPMFRVHRQLEISPNMRQTLYQRWREHTGNGQLQSLLTIAGFVTLVVGTLAAYLRLDNRTGAAYRSRLRVAALCVITAGGILALRLMA